MNIAEWAQTSNLGAFALVFAAVLSLAVAGASVAVLRLNNRCRTLVAENQELRYSLYASHERVDVVSAQLQRNLQRQREQLGQIADYLQHQRPINEAQFDAMRSADPLLPGSILPDVDLHATDDYDGEPLVHSDPSRVVASARPEPDMLAHLRPLPDAVGDVADESGLTDQAVANEPFGQVKHSVWGRQR